MSRDHSIQCERCGVWYSGFNGPDECECFPADRYPEPSTETEGGTESGEGAPPDGSAVGPADAGGEWRDPSEFCPRCGYNATTEKSGVYVTGVGMPEWIWLNNFGRVVWEHFGTTPYLVGSAAKGKTWRDVDVRLILDDEEFDRRFGGLSSPRCLNATWNAACLAFTALGREMTGLPIDFQIDRETEANEKYPGPREALILTRLAVPMPEVVNAEGDLAALRRELAHRAEYRMDRDRALIRAEAAEQRAEKAEAERDEAGEAALADERKRREEAEAETAKADRYLTAAYVEASTQRDAAEAAREKAECKAEGYREALEAIDSPGTKPAYLIARSAFSAQEETGE